MVFEVRLDYVFECELLGCLEYWDEVSFFICCNFRIVYFFIDIYTNDFFWLFVFLGRIGFMILLWYFFLFFF